MAKCEPGCTCGRHDPETRKKISENARCEPGCQCGHHRQEIRQQISERMRGRTVSEEERRKTSASLKTYFAGIPLEERRHPDGCTCDKHNGKTYVSAEAYFANHAVTNRHRGKAADQDCVSCAGKAAHWAQVHGTDGTNIWEHYQPMCLRCHYIYDDIWNRAKETRRKAREEGKKKL